VIEFVAGIGVFEVYGNASEAAFPGRFAETVEVPAHLLGERIGEEGFRRRPRVARPECHGDEVFGDAVVRQGGDVLPGKCKPFRIGGGLTREADIGGDALIPRAALEVEAVVKPLDFSGVGVEIIVWED